MISNTGGLFKIDSTEWTFKMPSEALNRVHRGVNTDFDIPYPDELPSNKSVSKLGVRDDIQHIHITNSSVLHETYEFGEVLGQGSFGRVICINDRTNKSWAMKIIPKTLIPTKISAIRQEIQILKIVRHPHIIFLHKVLESYNRIYLILEKCSGELGQLFRKSKPFSESDTKIIITQLASVVDYLHKHDIVHRDLKLENILLAPNPEDLNDELYIKVTDFGLGIIRGGFHEMLHDRCGTLTYLSPEIITKRAYSHQCDVWAMGVIMYLLLFGRYPFYAPVEQKLIKLICDVDPEYSHPTASDSAIHLISKMLAKDPALRITAAEIKEHAWIVGSPLSECKHENVLEMMRLWRSDMMLPQGTDCDWVSARLVGQQPKPDEIEEDNESQILPFKRPRNVDGKRSLKLPIHNIEFDRMKGKKKEEPTLLEKDVNKTKAGNRRRSKQDDNTNTEAGSTTNQYRKRHSTNSTGI